MDQLLEVEHVSVSINRSVEDVYRFAANPENLPQWASGLGGKIRKVDGAWLVDGPMGRIEVRFAAQNSFGVLDHDVLLPTGETVHNPLRVVPNAGGSELTFVLFRRLGVSDEDFAEDAATVARDLAALKQRLEQ